MGFRYDTGSKGLASGVATGTTTIAAQVGQFSASRQVTVSSETLSSITVNPAMQTLSGPNKTQQYQAVGNFSSNSSVDLTTQVTPWASSDTNTATISNAPGSQGLATTKQVILDTKVIISAKLNGVTGTGTLTVTR